MTKNPGAWKTAAVSLVAAFGWLCAACVAAGADGGDPNNHNPGAPNLRHVSMSVVPVGPGFWVVFLDQDTGDLWFYSSMEKPAEKIGRMESFDKPLVSAAFKAEYEKTHGGVKATEITPPPGGVAKPLPEPAGKTHPLAEKFNALPRNLWPTDDENDIKAKARDQWIKENIKPGPGTFAGKLSDVSTTTVNAPDQTGKVSAREVVEVRLEVEKVSLWGQEVSLYVMATLDSLKPADAMDWKKGEVVTITGNVESAKPQRHVLGTGYGYVDVEVGHAERVR